jgi:hypothetical protein
MMNDQLAKTIFFISDQSIFTLMISLNPIEFELPIFINKYVEIICKTIKKIIDTKSGMGVLGNLDQYMKYKVANAIGDAALREIYEKAKAGYTLIFLHRHVLK